MQRSFSLDELLQNDFDFKKINPSLDNIKIALEAFRDFRFDFQTIIIAGTNGKGSVATFLEQMLLEYSDLKIAKFTSPHLFCVTERIKVANENINPQVLADLLLEIKTKVTIALSYFEKITLAALLYFQRQKVDLAILEVGMGGRWDAVNIVPSENRLATVITSIGLDHQEFLGDSVEKIRLEKEAIKRQGVSHFDFQDYFFEGDVLEKNFLLAQKVFHEKIFNVNVNRSKIFERFYEVYAGRYQFEKDLNVFIDAAHNPQAAQELVLYLEKNFKKQKIELHVAFLDKDFQAFINEFVTSGLQIEKICFYDIDNSRAQKAQYMQELCSKLHTKHDFQCQKIANLDRSKNLNLKVFTGSIYFIEKVIAKIKGRASKPVISISSL